jgi:hypothetical protein
MIKTDFTEGEMGCGNLGENEIFLSIKEDYKLFS